MKNLEIVNIYIDWGRKTSHILGESEEEPCEVPSLELPKHVPKGSRLFMEHGCPYGIKANLLNHDCIVFEIDGKLTKKKREELGWKKTDTNDVLAIRLLHQDDSSLFVPLEEKKHLRIRKRSLMDAYLQYEKILVVCKNKLQANFFEGIPEDANKQLIELLESLKKPLKKKIEQTFSEEYRIIGQIKGIGALLVGKLLAYADPCDFPSKQAYLKYCGLTAESYNNKKGEPGKGKFSRNARKALWLMQESVIKQRKNDPRYYELYQKIRDDLREKFPEDPNYRNNQRARNRVSTFLAKEIYDRLVNNKSSQSNFDRYNGVV